MNEQTKYIMKWKLPELLFSFLKDGRKDEILYSMGSIPPERLLEILCAEEFPTEKELKGFCDHFKMRYSTIKTWNVLHVS